MVPSHITTQRVSPWSMMSFFAALLCLVPTAFTVAQDYEAVIKRLKQAVDAKEISPEQAKKMLSTLKISSVKQVPTTKPTAKKDASSAKVNWDAIEKKIEGAVKAGTLTRAQADAKYTALKKQTGQKAPVKKVASNAKLDWETIKKKIEGAVKAGTLTRAQADAKYTALEKQTAQKAPVKKVASNAKLDWEAIKNRIESGVKAGKLTREQAEARYLELKKQYPPKPNTSSKPDVKKDDKLDPRIAYEQAAKEIRAAVEAGKVTAEQGRARLEAYRKHLAERQEKGGPKAAGNSSQEQRRVREIKIRSVNGVNNIYVTENDRKTVIIDDPDAGIKIEITDTQDGKPVTRAIQANNIEELQKKSPEAYKLYKKYLQYAPSGKQL
jgi:predicted transcriptional regulator